MSVTDGDVLAAVIRTIRHVFYRALAESDIYSTEKDIPISSSHMTIILRTLQKEEKRLRRRERLRRLRAQRGIH